jgi:c-di-AMP phosphodiesterase-like protein
MERNIRLLIWLFIICIILYFISTTTLSNFITAISTSVIAYFTFYLFSETKKLREDQVKQIENLKKESIRPIIKLHLSLSTECLGVDKVYLHIENRGNGLAKNIKFNFLNNLSDTQQYLVNRLNNEPIFI